MLKICNISCFYGNVQALDKVSIEVEHGTLVTLLGSNGAGKTTTLKAISGLLRPKYGDIFFEDKSILKYGPSEIVGLGIIHVPEGRMIFPELTVMENLKMGAYLRKDKRNVNNDIFAVFKYFPILEKRHKQIAFTLSGGEQQMLAIARGLMARPKVLLLDEPSLGLAPIVVDEVFKIIKEINKTGTTILLVEQNAFKALQVSDKAYVLETGSVAMSGRSQELINNIKIKESYLGIMKGGEQVL